MENRIDLAATKLALAFADEINIPARFKNKTDKKSKQKSDSSVEIRFKKDVEQWKSVIKTMLNKVDGKLAWRFINITPSIDQPSKSVAYQKDFSDFIDYLVLRRDEENSSHEQLGRLAALSGEFQKELEKQLKN